MRALQHSANFERASQLFLRQKHLPCAPARKISTRVYATEKQLGEKLRSWIQTPFDIAAFGPRVTVGSLLSATEKIQQLPNDIQKLKDLIQDPRPNNEKAEIILGELENRLTETLEKGATIETDMLANIKSLLPDNLKEFIPPSPVSRYSYGDDVSIVEADISSEIITEERVTSEKDAIAEALDGARAALASYRSNQSKARVNMLRLNLKEAKENLSGLLEEVVEGDPGMDLLLTEVKQMIREIETELS